MKNFLIILGLLLFGSSVSALPAIGALGLNDSDGVVYYDTSYRLDFNITGVTLSTENVSSCSINSQAISYVNPVTAINGSGNWSVNMTFNGKSMEKNCTASNITVTCLMQNGTSITRLGNYQMIPCVLSYTNNSQVTAVADSSNSTMLISYLKPYNSVIVRTNSTPRNVNATIRTNCTVELITDKVNLTIQTTYVPYNSSTEYCPYDIIEVNSTAVQLRIATVKPFGPAPDNPFSAGYGSLVIFGITVGGAYLLGRRGRKQG
jgi:hypothetical protein